MIERKHVDHYAVASKVDRLVAERDVILTYALRVLLENGLLDHLALKGGTCLKKVYLGKTGRFSLDLDFTSLDLETEEFSRRFQKIFDDRTYFGIHFKIVDEYSRKEMGKMVSYGAEVEYAHDWNRAQFKVEVSFRERPILRVTPHRISKELYFKYCDDFQPFEVPCLQIEELLAEKVRAAYQRIEGRDLYDLYLLANKPYNRDLVKRLVAIKFWNIRKPFDPDTFFDAIKTDRRDWTGELGTLVRGRLPSRDKIIKGVLNGYSYLNDLDNEMREIISDSKAHRQVKMVKAIVEQMADEG